MRERTEQRPDVPTRWYNFLSITSVQALSSSEVLRPVTIALDSHERSIVLNLLCKGMVGVNMSLTPARLGEEKSTDARAKRSRRIIYVRIYPCTYRLYVHIYICTYLFGHLILISSQPARRNVACGHVRPRMRSQQYHAASEDRRYCNGYVDARYP